MPVAKRIEGILIERLLHGTHWLDYMPAERGRRYRAFRESVVRHPVLFGLLFALLAGAAARWIVPLFVPGFWDALTTGAIGHLVNFVAGVIIAVRAIAWIDERLTFDPHRFALAHFRQLAFPWLDAYDSIQIADKAELDRHVITARHARDVVDELTYGILVAKVADVLAQASDVKSLAGLDDRAFIDMMMGQKLDDPAHQRLMERLFEARVSAESLAMVAGGTSLNGLAGEPAVKEMLAFWLKWGAFQLRVDLPHALNHVGSQLSRGYLDLRGNVGQNALSYLGRHSEPADFPIVLIHGDASDDLATHAHRGLVYCSGDVGDDCGKQMTGGTIVVGGRPGNRFGSGMDDSTHPAVLIAYCAIDGYLPEDTMRNGLVLLLNKDVEAPPRFLRFEDGVARSIEPTEDPDQIYGLISEYVLAWRGEHDIAIPVELAKAP